jgi:hypothetical protein
MDDFITRSTALKDEFYGDLKDVVGAAKAHTFCSILGGAWYDGSSRRNGQEVLPLRASVEGYLRNSHGTTVTEEPSSALLTPTEVGQVLELTWRLLDTCVDDWIEKHGRDYASSDVFFRRGLVLPELFRDAHLYREVSVISSYTLSVTIAEQFANTDRKGMKSAIVSADFYLFKDRVLFFSPFVPGMKGIQLEAGVIPSGGPQALRLVGEHRGVGEYLLDYPEELLV